MLNSAVEYNQNELEDWEISRADELLTKPFVENMILFFEPKGADGPFAYDGCTSDISFDDGKWEGSFDYSDGTFGVPLARTAGTAFYISNIEDISAAKKLLTRLKLTRKYYIYDFSGGTRFDIPSEPFNVALMRRDGTYDQVEHALIKLAA